MLQLTSGWALAGSVTALLAALAVGLLLFHAGCALADVKGPGFFKSLLILLAALALCVPLAWALLWLTGRYDAGQPALLSSMRVLGLVVALPAAWLVSALVYSLLLATPLRKGLVIAGAELVLGGLLAALGTAAVMVVLATVQIARQPPSRTAGVSVPTLACK
jgi:hypothetical protein